MRVLVRAYMALNLGDDLYLDTLFRRYPHVNFEIESWYYDDYKQFCERYSNASIRKNKNFLVRLKEKFKVYDIDKRYIREFDSIIYIGGSIFKENPENNLLDTLCEREVEYASRNNIPYYFVSSNFGPYYTEEYVSRKRRMFEKCTKVFFRDTYSYEMFKDIKSVEYSEDFVFYSPYKEELSQVSCKKILGISVIDTEKRDALAKYNSEYMAFLKKTAEDFVKSGYEIRLFAFSAREGDVIAAEKLMTSLESYAAEKTEIVEYSGDIPKFLNFFAECEKLICTRFHSMVLAAMLQREFYPIIYSDKLLNIIKDMNLCESYYTFGEENVLRFSEFIPRKPLCEFIFGHFNEKFYE